MSNSARICQRVVAALVFMMVAASVFAQDSSVIKEILVRGNRRVLNDVILSVMKTKVGQPYIQANLDDDKKSIEDLGFFSAVDVRATPLEAGAYSVTVDVEEFPEIKEIRVSGNSVISADELMKVISLAPGQVFNANSVAPSIKAIEGLYEKRGYFARVSDFTPSTDTPGVVNLTIVELRVGTVSVQGNTRTRDWVMRRLIKTRSGEVFNGDQWGRDLRKVAGTGWFEPGTIRSIEDYEREQGIIDLTMEVKEARTGQFNVGLQLDPRSSLAGVIKLSESNFNGTGKSVGVDFLQTTRGGGASIGLDYFDPFWDRKDTTLSASVYSRVIYRFSSVFQNDDLDGDSYNERRTGATLGVSRPVKQDLSVGANLRYEFVKTNFNESLGSQDYVRQDGSVAGLNLNMAIDRRDLVVDPSRGDYLRAYVEPGVNTIDKVGGATSDESLIGTHFFGKFAVDYRKYMSDQPPRPRSDPDAPRRTLAFRAQYGLITGTIPYFEQFFVGGANSIRGYDEDRYWGKQMLTFSLEYRYPVQRSFYLIAFVDYGSAWGGYGSVNNFSQSNNIDMKLGFGPGLMVRTPLGPIRIDLGFNENGGTRTHFLIGTSF